MLYFTNRGAQEGGYDTTDNIMNNIWPRVYGSVAPNAIIKATTTQGEIQLVCTLSKPLYNKNKNQLEFTVTYLDGQRPDPALALSAVKMIITNNAPQVKPEIWSHLVTADLAVVTPTGTDGIYTLTLQHPDEAMGLACAPQRKTSTISIGRYIDGWAARFGTDPPNATLAYDPSNEQIGGVQIVTLTNPVYNEITDSLRFTAQLVYSALLPIGKNGLTVKNPSLFIDGGEDGFPTYAGNVFSIQYRNSTDSGITIWFGGDQPPCSKAEAANCDTGIVNDEYATKWKNLYDAGVFTRSGTHFYITDTSGKSTEVAVSNSIDVPKGETLRIIPPQPPSVGSAPEWYYKKNGKIETAGVVAWATKKGVQMPAPEPVTVYEYNLDSAQKIIWFDLSGVNGINTNATMVYEGPGCGNDINCGTGVTLPKVLKSNLDDYNGTNDGCPYSMTFASAKSCPNPKFYPKSKIDTGKPAWVVSTDEYTTTDASLPANVTLWNVAVAANKGATFTGLDLARAGDGSAKIKPVYHIWWSTNPVGQGWLKYLQSNKKGKTDAYGWAYDEKRWKLGDTFDIYGNPPDNKAVEALVHGTYKNNTYLNIDILKLM